MSLSVRTNGDELRTAAGKTFAKRTMLADSHITLTRIVKLEGVIACAWHVCAMHGFLVDVPTSNV